MGLVEIRKAEYRDAAGLANVHLNSWKEAYDGLLPEENLKNLHLSFHRRYVSWQNMLSSDQYNVFVAHNEEHGVIGFVSFGKARDKGYENYCEVSAIYLLKSYHKKGIGYKLLKEAFKYAHDREYKKVYLWALKDNPTIQFYLRAGATQTNDIKVAKIFNKEVEELCFIWADLNV